MDFEHFDLPDPQRRANFDDVALVRPPHGFGDRRYPAHLTRLRSASSIPTIVMVFKFPRLSEYVTVAPKNTWSSFFCCFGSTTSARSSRVDRKEATGALHDIQLRRLEERLGYLRELDERRAAILDSITQQGKLDPALKQAIDAADSKARLEDLYLPYRPNRRRKAQIAREAGLEPLAETLLASPDQDPEQMARRYVEPNKGGD